MRWAAFYRRPPILRGVSASQCGSGRKANADKRNIVDAGVEVLSEALKALVLRGNHEEIDMSQTLQERNKALVLEAFDTLFNKRDYLAAERYWSPLYIQPSAHIPPGRKAVFTLIKPMPPPLK